MATQETSTFMTPSPPSYLSSESVKPTLLALHGSGSNATVHTVQLARLMRVLRPYFEIESLQAPFPSPAGPGILPFFDGCGPFVRWLPPSEKITIDQMRRGESTSVMASEVETLVRDKVREVRGKGGKVVGLVGFSQGTKVVAGLLKGAEIRRAVAAAAATDAAPTTATTTIGNGGDDDREDWLDFSFALSICGSYPPPLVPQSATALLESSTSLSDEQKRELKERKIQIPTFHVQGNQDEWQWAGRNLIDTHYDVGEGKSEVVEWDMGHHYPVPVEDNETIKDWLVGHLGRVQEGKRV